MKAAALRTERQELWYTSGIFFLIIGNALLKLASNSTSSVIRWIITPIKVLSSIIEAHNFISRIVNRIEKERPIAVDDRGEKEKLHKSLSLKLYEFLSPRYLCW